MSNTPNVPTGAAAEPRPSLETLIADEIERAVARAFARERARLAPTTAPEPTIPGGLVAKKVLATMLALSVATVDRMVREGLHFEQVNGRRRFDPGACRAWLAARGRKPTTQAKKPAPTDDDVDVSREMRALGLVPATH